MYNQGFDCQRFFHATLDGAKKYEEYLRKNGYETEIAWAYSSNCENRALYKFNRQDVVNWSGDFFEVQDAPYCLLGIRKIGSPLAAQANTLFEYIDACKTIEQQKAIVEAYDTYQSYKRQENMLRPGSILQQQSHRVANAAKLKLQRLVGEFVYQSHKHWIDVTKYNLDQDIKRLREKIKCSPSPRNCGCLQFNKFYA